MTRLPARLLPLTLTLLLAACSGGGGGGDGATATAGGASRSPVALSVQWPASLTVGVVRSSSIRLPSRVQSLTMEVQVLAPDFAGRRHTVAVIREGGTEVTTVDGVIQPPDVNGLDLVVPVGSPRRFLVTATAEVVDAAGAVATLHYTGFLDLTVTGDGDGGVVVLHDGDGAAAGVPQVASVDLTGGVPGPLQVDSAAVSLGITATFSDAFQALDPPAAWSSDNPGVAQVNDAGLLQPAGRGSATLTVTVGGVELTLPVTVANSPPRGLTTTDRLPPAGDGSGSTGIADQTVAEDSSLTLELAADDPDGDPLAFVASSDAPEVATAVAGSRLTLTPAPNFNGAAHITVTANDGVGGTISTTFTLTVTPVNDPPVVAPVAAQTIPQGATLAALTASDVDGDPLTFAVTGGALPPGLTLGVDGTFAGSAAFTAAGPFTATVTVSDGHGGTVSTPVAVTVLDQTPPVFGVLAPVTAEAAGVTTSVALGPVTATDRVDGAVSATPDPSGPFAVGSYTITWTATDRAGNRVTATQQLIVQDTTAPAFAALPPVTVEATGASTAVALGPVSTTDRVDGVVSATPDQSGPFAVGSYTITWTATDGAGNWAKARQQLTVQDTTPPEVTLLFPVGGIVGASTDGVGGIFLRTTGRASDLVGVSDVTVIATGTSGVADVFPAPPITAQATANLTHVDGVTNWEASIDLAGFNLSSIDLEVVASDGVNTSPAGALATIAVGVAPAVYGGGADLSLPVDLAVDANGEVVVVDSGLAAVVRVTPATGQRTVVATTAVSGATPLGIDVAPDGSIFVADNGQQAILGVDEVKGSMGVAAAAADPVSGVGNPAIDLGGPFGVAVEPSGDLFVLDAASDCDDIVRIARADGDHTLFISPVPCSVEAIAEDGGSLFYVGGQALYRDGDAAPVSAGGGRGGGPSAAAGGGFNDPIDLAVEGDGQILVVDSVAGFVGAVMHHDALLRVDPATGNRTYVSAVDTVGGSGLVVGVGAPFMDASAVAVDAQGRIFVLGSTVGFSGGLPGCTFLGVWQVEPGSGDRSLLSSLVVPGSCGGLVAGP